MFDISFTELALIGVVALVVIGPERLPRLARTAGVMFGRLQRYVGEVKAEINREVELDELRNLKSQVQDAARSIEQSVTQAAREIETNATELERGLQQAGTEVGGALTDAAPASGPGASAGPVPPSPAQRTPEPEPRQGTLQLPEPGAR